MEEKTHVPTGKASAWSDSAPNSVEVDGKVIGWSDFAQSTTFHGIKYIFDSAGRGFFWRRIIWTAIVLVAVSTFLVQVGMRMSRFGKYETVTDVKHKYETRIKFPAVTICNQNTYRITKASDWNIYDFIDKFYERGDETKFENTTLDGNETAIVLESTSHQLEDIIERCQWAGSPCDQSVIEKTLTSNGLCFTFNSGKKSPPLYVTKAGYQGLLELHLNAETYEHMRGPNNDAGIKIHLHDQEISSVAISGTKGIMVAPGKHYFVTIEQSQFEQQPSPYGQCDPNAERTKEECMAWCRSKEKATACNCSAPYRDPYDDGTETCNLTQLLFCFNNEKEAPDSYNETEKTCGNDCTYPCHSTIFTARVSFAEFSKFNVERLLLGHKEEIEAKFLHANEIRQRVVDATVQADLQMTHSFFEALSYAEKTVVRAMELMNKQNLWERLAELCGVINKDYQKIDIEVAFQYFQFVSFVIKVDEIQDKATSLLRTLKPDDISKLYAILQECKKDPSMNTSAVLKNVTYSDQSKEQEFVPIVSDVSQNGSFDAIQMWIEHGPVFAGSRSPPRVNSKMNVSALNSTNCADVMNGNSSITAQQIFTFVSNLKGLINNLFERYEQMITQNFYRTGVSPQKFPEHSLCIPSLGDLLAIYSESLEAFPYSVSLPTFEKVVGLVGQALNVSIAAEKAAMHRSGELYNDARKCNWLPKYNNKESIFHFMKAMGEGKLALNDVLGYSVMLISLEEQILEIINGELVNISDWALAYMEGNITKYKLASYFKESGFSQKLDELRVLANDYRRKGSEIASPFSKSLFTINWVFEEIIGLHGFVKVPIMNETFVLSLEFSRRAASTLIQEFKHANNSDLKMKVYTQIVHQVYDDVLGTVLRNATVEVDKAMANLIKSLAKADEYLRYHWQECQFGTTAILENFLQVEISYDEVKYELISQRPAFEVLGLLSEVGGFLGLLLGASVLTVFEFLDYVSLKAYYKWKIQPNQVEALETNGKMM